MLPVLALGPRRVPPVGWPLAVCFLPLAAAVGAVGSVVRSIVPSALGGEVSMELFVIEYDGYEVGLTV